MGSFMDFQADAMAKTMPYDVVEQLRTPQEMAAYLDAWLSEAPEDVAGKGSRPAISFV